MTGRSDGSEPPTTRIAGGSARGTAAAVAVVLVVVAWLGASGRPRQPQAVVPSPAAAGTGALATAAAVGAGGAPAASPPALSTGPSPWPVVSPAAPHGALPALSGNDAFAIIIHAAGMPRPYLQLLREAGPGLLETTVVMTDPRPPVDGTFELAQLWTREEGPPFVVLESFPLPIDALLGTDSAPTVIQVTSPARPDRPDLPRLMRRGYRMSVQVVRRDGQPFLTVRVSVGGPLPARELGDDGLIGDPGASEGGATR